MAQASDCAWRGTITVTRGDSGSTSTPIPASINDRGGTQTQTYSKHDVTTIQVQGDQATATREAWNICNAPKPQHVDQTATRPAGPVETYTFTGTLNPDDPTVMDGSHTDQVTGGATTTVTWHLLSACGPCRIWRRNRQS